MLRNDAPMERRMAALQTILSSVTGRNLAIEPRPKERDVIVVSGKWELHALRSDERFPDGIHFYTAASDLTKNAGASRGEFKDMLSWLSRLTQWKVVDETQGPRPDRLQWYNHRALSGGRLSEVEQDQLLENLTKQTSLEFVRTKRMIPIWFVREKPAATQPANHQ
jgi:hypothetical protein